MFARRDYIRDYMMIPPGTGEAAVVNMIVEIPKGKRNKYEVDKSTGLIKLDRYLYSSAVYPGDYGFVPQTLAEDVDPLDILVMVNEPTFSGCLIEARVVGLFRMKDKGLNDFKILAVPHKDPLFGHIRRLEDVPAHFLREVEFFFATYKQLEGVTVEPLGWGSHEEGTAEVRGSVERFRSSLGSVRDRAERPSRPVVPAEPLAPPLNKTQPPFPVESRLPEPEPGLSWSVESIGSSPSVPKLPSP